MFARSFMMCLLLPGCIVVGKDFEDTAEAAEFEDLGEQVAALSARLDAIEGRMDDNDARLDALDGGVGGKASRLDELEGRLDGLEEDLIGQETRLAALEGAVVTVLEGENEWPVSDVAGLQAALAALDYYRIATDGHVTIQLANGEYGLDAAVELHHPDAARLRIVGNLANPEAVRFSCEGDCFVVNHGAHLGYIGGISLRGTKGSGQSSGLVVTDGSYATVGPMAVQGMPYTGVLVERGSFIEAYCSQQYVEGGGGDAFTTGDPCSPDWFSVSDSEVDGIRVQYQSGAYVPMASVTGAGSTGFLASGGSFVYATGATSDGQDVGLRGFVTADGSFSQLTEATASNWSKGMEVSGHSGMDATDAVLTGNGNYSVDVSMHSYGSLGGLTASNVSVAGITAENQSYVYARGTEVSGDYTMYHARHGSYLDIGENDWGTLDSGSTHVMQGENSSVYAAGAPEAIQVSHGENDVLDFLLGWSY